MLPWQLEGGTREGVEIHHVAAKYSRQASILNNPIPLPTNVTLTSV
jgi:hypothetical protein